MRCGSRSMRCSSLCLMLLYWTGLQCLCSICVPAFCTSRIEGIYTLVSEGRYDESLRLTETLLESPTAGVDLDSLSIHKRYLILRRKTIDHWDGGTVEKRCEPVAEAVRDNPYVAYELFLGNVMYGLTTAATETASAMLEKLFFQTATYFGRPDAVNSRWLASYLNDLEVVTLLLCHGNHKDKLYLMFSNYLSHLGFTSSSLRHELFLRAGRAYTLANSYADAATCFMFAGLGRDSSQFPGIDREALASYYIMFMRSLFALRELEVVDSIYDEFCRFSDILEAKEVDPYVGEEYLLLHCLGLVAREKFEEARTRFLDLLGRREHVGSEYYRSMALFLWDLCTYDRQLKDRVPDKESWRLFLTDCAALDPVTFADFKEENRGLPEKP